MFVIHVLLSVLFFALTMVTCENALATSCNSYSNQQLYLAQNTVFGKIKNIKKTKYGQFLQIKITKVLKDNIENIGRGETMIVQYGFQKCNRAKLRKNKSYIFILNKGDSHWEVSPHPIKSSKKTRKMVKILFCKSCRKIQPRLKKFRKSNIVKQGRRYKLKCRLQFPPILPVTFIWKYANNNISETENFKIKTRKRGSDLLVKGLASTAGKYTCVASSHGGTFSVSTLLYVEGSPSTICEANYCINGGLCSVVKLGGGERELSCACTTGFQGLRCEVKYIPLNVITSVIVVILVVGLILLFYYLYRRIKNIESKLIKKHCSYSHLETEEKDINEETKANAVSIPDGNNDRLKQNGFSKSQYLTSNLKIVPIPAIQLPPLQIHNNKLSINASQSTLEASKLNLDVQNSPQDSPASTLTGQDSTLTGYNSTLGAAPSFLNDHISTLAALTSTLAGLNSTLTPPSTLGEHNSTLSGSNTSCSSPVYCDPLTRKASCSSPVYCDPWDITISPCVHGGDICCSICVQEATDIVRECGNYK